jgi:hypothetical protein
LPLPLAASPLKPPLLLLLPLLLLPLLLHLPLLLLHLLHLLLPKRSNRAHQANEKADLRVGFFYGYFRNSQRVNPAPSTST